MRFAKRRDKAGAIVNQSARQIVKIFVGSGSTQGQPPAHTDRLSLGFLPGSVPF